MLPSIVNQGGRLVVPLPKPTKPGPTYVIHQGACFGPGCNPASDIPCGFTDLGSLLSYFEFGAPGAKAWTYNAVYSMPWVSALNGVVASGAGITTIAPHTIYFAAMYCSLATTGQAWYSLEQLGVAVGPSLAPLVSSANCGKYGLSYVAINPFGNPWPSSMDYYTWGATVFNPTVWGLPQL
jgi:hypothetical protein